MTEQSTQRPDQSSAPVPPDFRALCAKVIQYNEGQGKYNFSHLDRLDREDAAFDAWQEIRSEIKHALDRSRRAPQAAEETGPIRQAAEQARQALEGWVNHGEWVWPESALEQAKRDTAEALTALNAALAQPVPPRPTDEEIIAFWSDHCAGDGDAGILRLARWGNTTPQPLSDLCDLHADMVAGSVARKSRSGSSQPALAAFDWPAFFVRQVAAKERLLKSALAQPKSQPVPVSERMPGPEDCDAEGRCWFSPWHQQGYAPNWRLIEPYLRHFSDAWWLPAHALPTPGDNQ